MQHDLALQQALQLSTRTGDLLLKTGEQERSAIEQLTSQLLESEHRRAVRLRLAPTFSCC